MHECLAANATLLTWCGYANICPVHDQAARTAYATRVVLLLFPVGGAAEFQVEVGENRDTIFFLLQVHQPPEFCPWTAWGLCGL